MQALITGITDQDEVYNEKIVEVWDSVKPKREFLYIDELIKADEFLMNLDKKIYNKNILLMCSYINAGISEEIIIKKLANLAKETVGYMGKISFSPSKPVGNQRKFIDSKILKKFEFNLKMSLKEGQKKLTKTI
jgi:GDP-L-fucose synthase